MNVSGAVMPVLLIALAVVRVEVDEREGHSNPLIGCIISSREQRIRPGGHDSWPPGESRSRVTSGSIYRSSASRPVEAGTAGATATRKPVRTQAR
jgi:hypothetical protein